MTIELRLPAGNQPALALTTSFGFEGSGGGAALANERRRGELNNNLTMGLVTMDGTTERDPCNAAGGCHFGSGVCECDEFRGADSDVGDCGR